MEQTTTRWEQAMNGQQTTMNSNNGVKSGSTSDSARQSDSSEKQTLPSDSTSRVATGGDSPPWRLLGRYSEINKVKCRRVHAKLGSSKDLVLFHEEGKFYAMGAWCSHMGGPLFQGQIEDYKGTCHVMCPWHAYMFDLKTGKNELGLQQDVFPVKVESGTVYIQHKSELSLNPFL
ncbi:Rieske domain-containing protein-like [Haliotis rubra]|uniref:Rieske domain-containing protein-like n=1 Tax=Haliotis rubra TaxID=36100 RepID=UPI001EE5F64A|nr:Rieske domain-containing protein-like [Haliotis rubra]